MIYFCKMLQMKPQRHSYPLTENSYLREYTPKETNQGKPNRMMFTRKLPHTAGRAVRPLGETSTSSRNSVVRTRKSVAGVINNRLQLRKSQAWSGSNRRTSTHSGVGIMMIYFFKSSSCIVMPSSQGKKKLKIPEVEEPSEALQSSH